MTTGQQWTWPLIEGMTESMTGTLTPPTQHRYYPSVGVGPDPPQDSDDEPLDRLRHQRPKPWWWKCIGCRGHHGQTRREHSRIRGECKYPDVEVEAQWQCPACARVPPRERGNAEHTEQWGERRWATAPTRTGRERTGRHPREARIRRADDGSADVPPRDLNRGAASSSSAAPPRPPPPEPEERRDDPPLEGGDVVVVPPAGERALVPAPEARRAQPQVVDAAAGDSIRADWTSFDVNHSLRALRTGTEAQQRREVRKLHLRWWHATRVQMERILGAAGVPSDVIALVPGVIDTCRECRAWQKPGPDPTPSIELAERQNEQIEGDILFFREHMVWHMVDRADRWHASTAIPTKTTAALLEAISRCWIQVFGPFKILIVDGEAGLASAEAKEYFARQGIEVRTRAPQQHARIIERRGAILRHAMHCIEEQLRRDEVTCTFDELLAEATFAGNALVTYNGASPFNARFGSQPNMLPEVQAPLTPAGGRDLRRLREVALQKIVESTAVARITRSLRTATRPAGEALDYKPGELVDFYRPPKSKDTHAWHGPAVVKKSHPGRGLVVIRWENKDMSMRFADIRRFMDFGALVYHTGPCRRDAANEVLETLQAYMERLQDRHFVTLGYQRQGGEWHSTTESRNQPRVNLALDYALTNVLQLTDVYAVRLGRGVARFPTCEQATHSIIVWWATNPHDMFVHEYEGAPAVHTAELAGELWPKNMYLQILMSNERDDTPTFEDLAHPGHSTSSRGSEGGYDDGSRSSNDPIQGSRLSTISEGEERGSAWLTHDFVHVHECCNSDTADQVHILSEEELAPHIEELASTPHEPIMDERPDWNDPIAYWQESTTEIPMPEPTHHFMARDADPEGVFGIPEVDTEGNQYVELLCPGDCAKLVSDIPPEVGKCYRIRVYMVDVKRSVVERDIDLLSPSDYQQYRSEVITSTSEELGTWIKHECFVRRSRKLARNILDVRWVGKWKKVPSKTQANLHTRIIRMRLTLRGFKDRDANDIETYAGTSSRTSQRLVTSEAVCQGWKLTTIDVKKAFLKGISYAELARTTGAPLREVCFELSPEVVTLLRQFPGYKDFDPRTEVLAMTKPGTGCKDAPKCFAIKLAQATNGVFRAKPSLVDDQLLVRHVPIGRLDFIATKHVDDIKIACSELVRAEFITALEQVFGKNELEITYTDFTNCGLRHIWSTEGYSIDQTEYLKALKPIIDPQITGLAADTLAPEQIAKQFLSLLMAVAYTLQTRVDLCVYVNALQRHAQTPTILHVRRLNAIVRWAQRNPLSLMYRRMTPDGHLTIYSDAGFRKEEKEGETTGRAVRGANYVRSGKGPSGKGVVHLLHWDCSAIKTVTRSTFTSELQAAIMATETGVLLATTLHEITQGALTPTQGMTLRDTGKLCIKIALCIDAMSVWSALSMERVKAPAEKSMLLHLLWIKEQLITGTLDSLIWMDTRIMLADGHTKGSIDRSDLRNLAMGAIPPAGPDMVKKFTTRRAGAAAPRGLATEAPTLPPPDTPAPATFEH